MPDIAVIARKHLARGHEDLESCLASIAALVDGRKEIDECLVILVGRLRDRGFSSEYILKKTGVKIDAKVTP